MIECDGARTIQRRVHDMVDGLLKFARVLEPESADATPAIVRSRHVGTNIFSVPLATFAGKSQLPFMKVVADASPAWTMWNGWLILAAHREHIERILDAQYGLVPVLGSVKDVRELRLRESGRSAVSIVQPDLATEVLEEWLASYDSGAPSLLDPVWWGGQPRTGAGGSTSPIRGVELMEETAVVVVKSVDKGSAAGGRLAPGDRILGIDGSLLTTDAPLADLAARWKKSRNRAGPTLRIQRGESLADVTVPKSQATERVPRRRIDPAGAVREIAALGRALEFASYAVDVSHTAHYSARVSLRFRSGQVTKANTK